MIVDVLVFTRLQTINCYKLMRCDRNAAIAWSGAVALGCNKSLIKKVAKTAVKQKFVIVILRLLKAKSKAYQKIV